LKIVKFDLFMQLCVHSNIGNNNFCENKTNHKISNLFMHTCCCTLFYAMSSFIQMPKGFKNLLKIYLEKQFGKRKEILLSPYLFSPFWPAGRFPLSLVLGPLALPSFSPSRSLLGPAQAAAGNGHRHSSLPLADQLGPLVSALFFPNFLLRSHSHGHDATVARAHLFPRRGSVRALASIKGSPLPSLLPCRF
jgi:hypothetical protein